MDVHISGRTIRLRRPPPSDVHYWTELWPAARALARFLLSRAIDGDVLELGCGLGLGGIAAGLAGARTVTFSDHVAGALAFASESAHLNDVTSAATLLFDWAAPAAPRRWPIVIGSDLLYEPRMRELLARALAATLAPGGIAWIADPERMVSRGFAAIAAERGLGVSVAERTEGMSVYEVHQQLR